MVELLLLGLVASLCLGVLLVGALTLRRLTGKVTLDLDLGLAALAQAERERNEARALAESLRAELSTLTDLGLGVGATAALASARKARASHGTQDLRSDVTSDVTQKPRYVTRPLNPEAKVTAYTEDGQAFEVPQEPLTATPEAVPVKP